MRKTFGAAASSATAALPGTPALHFRAGRDQVPEGVRVDVARGLVNGLALSALLWAAGLFILV